MSDEIIVDPEFDTRIREWFSDCQKLVDDHMNKEFPTNPKKVLKMETLKKFVRITESDTDTSSRLGGSLWAFVAMEDNVTKALGKVTKGDIFKGASYTMPAKNARGNIFDSAKGMGAIGPYGPAYMRNL
jgi:hypothetical protein